MDALERGSFRTSRCSFSCGTGIVSVLQGMLSGRRTWRGARPCLRRAAPGSPRRRRSEQIRDRGQRTWPVLTSLKSVLKHYLVQLCKALVFTEVGHTACVCMWLSTHPRVSATSVRGARECLTRRAKRRKAVLGLALGAGSSRVRRGRTSSSEGPAVTCWLPHRRPLPSRSPFPSTRLCRLPPSWG